MYPFIYFPKTNGNGKHKREKNKKKIRKLNN